MVQLVIQERNGVDLVVYGIDLGTNQVVFIPPLPLSDYTDVRYNERYGWVITRKSIPFIVSKLAE